ISSSGNGRRQPARLSAIHLPSGDTNAGHIRCEAGITRRGSTGAAEVARARMGGTASLSSGTLGNRGNGGPAGKVGGVVLVSSRRLCAVSAPRAVVGRLLYVSRSRQVSAPTLSGHFAPGGASMIHLFTSAVAALFVLFASALPALAEYPAKPITWIVPA